MLFLVDKVGLMISNTFLFENRFLERCLRCVACFVDLYMRDAVA